MTTAVLSNTTSPGSPLAVGDSWELQIQGAPNQDVYATGSFPSGETFRSKFGVTDAEGNFTDEGTETQEHIGNWVITWSVGNEAAPTMRFNVAGPVLNPVSMNTALPLVTAVANPVPYDSSDPFAQVSAAERLAMRNAGLNNHAEMVAWVQVHGVINNLADMRAFMASLQNTPEGEQTTQPEGLSIPLWAQGDIGPDAVIEPISTTSIPTWVWIAGAVAVAWYAFGRKA